MERKSTTVKLTISMLRVSWHDGEGSLSFNSSNQTLSWNKTFERQQQGGSRRRWLFYRNGNNLIRKIDLTACTTTS